MSQRLVLVSVAHGVVFFPSFNPTVPGNDENDFVPAL